MSKPSIRARFSSDIHDGIYVRYGAGTSEFLAFGSTWKSFRRYEYINDVIGSPKTQRVKPVDHVKAQYTGLPYQSFNVDHHILMEVTNPESLPHIDIVSMLESDMFLIPHPERVQASQEAFNSFADRFPTKISFAEFAQGLFELSALIPKLSNSLTRTISSGYLTKKFGWDNLISDLRQFSSLAGSIRERMEFLKRTYGKPTKLYFRKPDLRVETPGQTTYWSPGRSWGVKLVLRSYSCDFTAGATLLQKMDHIDDFIGWLRGIVISLGLNSLIESGWKTSRLSFVVDWFVNVSGALHRLSAIQPADPWDVYDVYSSVKIKAEYEVWQYNWDVDDNDPNQDRFLGHLNVDRYQRWVGLPLDLSLFTPSSLSPDQLVLLLAMGGSK